MMFHALSRINIHFKRMLLNFIKKQLYHINFKPNYNSIVEKSYDVITVTKLYKQSFVFGLTLHAEQRMKERGITKNMVITSIKNAKLQHEYPQKKWDKLGRILFIYNKLIVVTNFEQNRIVTVYWKVDNWSLMNKEEKQSVQTQIRKEWISNNNTSKRR